MLYVDSVNEHGFISGKPYEEKEFTEGDEYCRYIKSLKTQPADWIYRNLKITYRLNSLGFRCCEHTQLKDYILFTGCSMTFGTGLPIEKTYPYLVSQKLGMPYYNLAVPSTGPDVLKSNLLLFCSLVRKNLPKLVVLQWPSFYRCFLINDSFTPILYLPQTENTGLYNELINNDKLLYTNIFNRHYICKFLENYDIKHFHFMDESGQFFKNQSKNIVKVTWPNFDKARDLSHPGILDHKFIAEEIFRTINSK